MPSHFADGRALLAAALQRCFSEAYTLVLPDQEQISVNGYIKWHEPKGHIVGRLLTEQRLPEKSTLLVNELRYQLVAGFPVKHANKSSQLVREYMLIPENSGAIRHGWSEFDSD